jgi:ATP-dependent Clp protease ATP-binding subunit ClpX
MRYISALDLKSFGLIPELIGRLPVLTHLEALDRDALMKILTEPKNAITKQYDKLFLMEGVTLHWDDSALNYIVDQALQYGLGARGLRSICESIITDAMFEVPSQSGLNELTISLEYAREKFGKTATYELRSAA